MMLKSLLGEDEEEKNLPMKLKVYLELEMMFVYLKALSLCIALYARDCISKL